MIFTVVWPPRVLRILFVALGWKSLCTTAIDHCYSQSHTVSLLFNSHWYQYESLVAAGRASVQNCSRAPAQVLLVLVGMSEPFNKQVDNVKFWWNCNLHETFKHNLQCLISIQYTIQIDLCLFICSSFLWHVYFYLHTRRLCFCWH